MPFRLFGCFRRTELQGGFAVSLIGHRTAGAPHPSLTPYSGILYPQCHAKYVTEISNNKEIGGVFAAFVKKEFDWVELPLGPEVVDLQPFISGRVCGRIALYVPTSTKRPEGRI